MVMWCTIITLNSKPFGTLNKCVKFRLLPKKCIVYVLFQVDKLSAEIHKWKKRNKDKVDSETQTEEYVWTEAGVSFLYAD